MTPVTSVNNIGSDVEFILRERSFMYIMHNRVPRIDPWGNPCFNVSCRNSLVRDTHVNLFPYRTNSCLEANCIFYSSYLLYALFLYVLTYTLIF